MAASCDDKNSHSLDLGKQRGVNAAVHDPCAAAARDVACRVSTQRVASMHADANNVSAHPRVEGVPVALNTCFLAHSVDRP